MAYRKLDAPNHTQTPNIFFDDSLPTIKSFAELKVILAIVRQTFGWHKADDRISISQLMKLTGLTRQGVINGVARALKDGFLDRQPVGDSFTYSLRVVNEVDQGVVNEVDQSQPPASQRNRPEVVNEIDSQLVNEVDPQKKKIKEKKESKEPSPHSRLMEFHSLHLKGPIPDGGAQGAAIKWLLASYKPETCETCYESLLNDKWRSKVSWLTVKSEIGSWLTRQPEAASGGEKIVADYGDWYLVESSCGDGGTSPRYRTPEAFARETGRDLEIVKAGWN